MRNLTIQRTKSFVGSFAKIRVYIEDHCTNELTIKNIPCRKLGELKNGETKTFRVGEESVRIFVIADTVSKDICNEVYMLPTGSADIFLSGKNTYNPMAGNPFRFDGVTDEMTLQNRKQSKGKNVVVLVVALLIGLAIGFFATSGLFSSDKKGDPKTFSSDGMRITLTDQFKKLEGKEFSDYTVCYATKDFVVLALEERFSLYPGLEDYTLEEYGDMAIAYNGLTDSYLRTKDGITFFEYTGKNPDNGEVYEYFACVYKTEDAFWLIQFSAGEEDSDKYEEQFLEWASSVEFYEE